VTKQGISTVIDVHLQFFGVIGQKRFNKDQMQTQSSLLPAESQRLLGGIG